MMRVLSAEYAAVSDRRLVAIGLGAGLRFTQRLAYRARPRAHGRTSAHTVFPQAFIVVPHRCARSWTIRSPRPLTSSASGA